MNPHRGTAPNSVWTAERDALLQKLVAENHSYSVIAAELGGGISRHAAIGRAYRLGFGGGRGSGFNCNGPRTKKQASAERQLTQRVARRGEPADAPSIKPEPFVPRAVRGKAPQPKRLTLMELTPRTCRWPFGDGAPFEFCGHDKPVGGSYCGYHMSVAFNAPPQRVRRAA